MFLNSTIQQYIDKFSKNNIPNSIKELLDSDTVNPGSLPFCIAVTIRKFKALVTEWVKNHINIKSKQGPLVIFLTKHIILIGMFVDRFSYYLHKYGIEA